MTLLSRGQALFMMRNELSAGEVLEKAKTILGYRIAFDMPYLLGLKFRIVDEGLETACLTRDGEIQLGRKWLEDRANGERRGWSSLWSEGRVELVVSTLHHEIDHWRRKHHPRGELLLSQAEARGVPSVLRVRGQEYPLQYVLNLSGDYSINGDMERDDFPLGADWVRAQNMGWVNGLSMEDYFWKFVALHEEPKPGGSEDDSDSGKDSQTGQDDQDDGPESKDGGQPGGEPAPKSGVGQGACGSGAGQAVEGELPSEGEPVSQVQQDVMDMKSAKAIEAEIRANGPGSVGANLKRFAAQVLGHKKIGWRKKLRTLASRAMSFSVGSTVYTYTNPSILQGAMGYGDGVARLAGTHKPDINVVFAIDSSGSMSRKATGKGVAQAADVISALGAKKITFMVCDTEVRACVNIRSAKEIEDLLSGGGGTKMSPIFDEVEKMRPRPQLVIVATDGDLFLRDIERIRKHPVLRRTKVIWLLTEYPNESLRFPGEVILLED